MDFFGITDGRKCADICRYAPPSKKWPCVDCDMRVHDRAEPKDNNDYQAMEMLESITGYKYEWTIRNGQRVCEPVRTEDGFVKAPFVSIEDFLFIGE